MHKAITCMHDRAQTPACQRTDNSSMHYLHATCTQNPVLHADVVLQITLMSSNGDKIKLRITPARPAATGTAYVRLGSSPGGCTSIRFLAGSVQNNGVALQWDSHGQPWRAGILMRAGWHTHTVKRAKEYVYTCKNCFGSKNLTQVQGLGLGAERCQTLTP